MKKELGILLGLVVLSSMFNFNVAMTQSSLLFEGYLDKGESVFVGPLIVHLARVQQAMLDDGSLGYKAMVVIIKDGKPINANYTSIKIPDPQKIQHLLTNTTFLNAMGETLGYNMTDPLQYGQFLMWLGTASQEEIGEAVFKTIQEHPELGITLEDITRTISFPTFQQIGENETISLNVDGEKVTITALQVYPNGAKLSISGPPGWKASTLPAYITTWVEAPKSVKPGDEITIKVHLKNEGALEARYVTVILSPMMLNMNSNGSNEALAQTLSQSGLVQSVLLPVDSATKYVEYIEGKEEKVLEFHFKVNENADPGIYPLYVNVMYSIGMGQSMEMIQGFDYFGITVARESDATFELLDVEKPEKVYPGQDFEIKVKLKNMGMEVAKNLLVKLETVQSVDDMTSILIDNSSDQQYTSIVKTNREVQYTFRLHVKEDAKTGSYPLTLKLSYYSGDAKDEKKQDFKFSIQVLRKNQAYIEVEGVDTPKSIEPGDEFTLKIRLKNVGDETARAFSLKIVPSEVQVQSEVTKIDLSAIQNLPIQGSQSISENLQSALNDIMKELAKQKVDAFLPVGEDNAKYVGELAPNEEIAIEFHLKASERLESGVYPLKVDIEYLSSPDDEKISDERVIGISVLGSEHLIISKVSTSPSRVLAGTNNVEVSLEVENIGSGSARYVILKPLPEKPFELSETSEQLINLGSLKGGDSAKAVFRVNVDGDAKGGNYEIPVEIDYRDSSGDEKELRVNVPIIINEKPKVVVESVRFDKTPMQGEDVKIYVKLKNVGGEQAENVIIEGVVKADQPFALGKRTDYVGDLNPGKDGEGVLELSINRDAIPKDYTIQVRIRAVGDKESGDDNVYVFEDSIKVPVKENLKTKGNLGKAGILIGILAVLAVVITYMKRKR